jgi:hypothetical protein
MKSDCFEVFSESCVLRMNVKTRFVLIVLHDIIITESRVKVIEIFILWLISGCKFQFDEILLVFRIFLII